MRRNIYLITVVLAGLLATTLTVAAQEETQEGPAFVTVSTWHWNMDYEDFDMDTWKAVEKEYYDKVTAKNELIMGSGVYLHHFTPDNSELLRVNSFASWEDIDKATERSNVLIREGWPDEAAREAFMQKRNAYYSDMHSDEIYATLANRKATNIAEAGILYIRRNHFAFPEEGSMEEFSSLEKEYVDNVFRKNELIKGYYPLVHAWGSDRTDFVEAFLLDSMENLEKLSDRNRELYRAHWADESARKEREKKAGKYFTGVHGDYIYDVVSELVK